MEAFRTAFYYNPELERIRWPENFPFRGERPTMAREILFGMGLLVGPGLVEMSAPAAGLADLETFHQHEYLEVLQQADAGHFDPAWLWAGLGRDDTPVFPGMFAYAALACGATLAAADNLRRGELAAAFNPAGGFHHARANRAAGFCYLNDLVLGCRKLAEGENRVVYLDIDAHHGDGVQEAFYETSSVFTMSLHENGKFLYPGTGWEHEIGKGEGEGYNLCLPLPPGTYDDAYLRVIDGLCLPLIRSYGPDFIVLQCGMDGLHSDPLANLKLTNESHARVVRRLQALGVPLLVTGGGGYHPPATARGWARVWSVLSGQEEEYDPSLGLGGVMLESTEHAGGLRDREIWLPPEERGAVDRELDQSLDRVRGLLFPRHGL